MTDDRSNLLRRGWLVKATKMVGTAAMMVTLFCSTGVNNGGDIFYGIDLHGGRFGRGCGHNGIKKKMPGFMPSGFGYFSQQSAYECLQGRQAGFDIADYHRFHIGSFYGCYHSGVKLGMVHAEQRAHPAVLELVIEFTGRVKGVAGDTNGPGFLYAEIDGRVMGDVGQKDRHPLPLFNAVGGQEGGHPVGRVPDHRCGPHR